MAMKSKSDKKPEPIASVDLAAVTGGCAACGSASCLLRRRPEQQAR